MILAVNLGIKAFSTTTMSNSKGNGDQINEACGPGGLKFDILALQYIRILS